MSDSPVHLAGKRSREAAMARDKDSWLAVFADDAIVEAKFLGPWRTREDFYPAYYAQCILQMLCTGAPCSLNKRPSCV